VDDAKLLFASDRVSGKPLAKVDEYLLQAIEAVRGNRRKYSTSRQPKLAESNHFGFKTDQ
jgi:hypothetical protein